MIRMKNIVFLVPQQGTLDIKTEFGRLTVAPNEICVIQQGIKFSVGVSELSRYYFFHVKIAMKFKKGFIIISSDTMIFLTCRSINTLILR